MKLNYFCYIAIFLHSKTSNYSMWLPLAAITHSNRGRKLLQTFLTKPFLIDRHVRFTEDLSSSALLWRVLQAFSSMCIYKLKSRWFKSCDCEDQKSLGQKFMLASDQSCTAFATVHDWLESCPIRKRSLIS